jgi:ATP-dependent RNA helicase DHX57
MEGLIESVKKLGFMEPHVREAIGYCGSREEVLDWLCLHVPEEDLPEKFKPNVPTIDTFLHDQVSLAREYQARRLAAFGFPREDCLKALLNNGDADALALRALVDELVGSSSSTPEGAPDCGR